MAPARLHLRRLSRALQPQQPPPPYGRRWSIWPAATPPPSYLDATNGYLDRVFTDQKLDRTKLHLNTRVLKKHLKKLLAGILIWLVVLLCFRRNRSPTRSSNVSATSSPHSRASIVDSRNSDVQPLTLVATWLGDKDRDVNSFPAWLNSLATQTAPVELIWLNFISEAAPTCLDITKHAAGWKKVRQICVHRDELYAYITNMLCTTWECTTAEEKRVTEHMRYLNHNDDNLVLMRPFIGHFLRDHIKTAWWAWLDSDMLLGDMASQFPYDIMEQFDIITFAEGQRESIYLHGQFTAFRQAAMLKHLQSARAYSSPEEFCEKMRPDHNAEEKFWSDTILRNERLRNKLNWLQVKGRHNDVDVNERLVVSGNRVLSVPMHATRAEVVMRLTEPTKRFATFTSEGHTKPMNKSHEVVTPCGPWNPINFCPLVDADDEADNRVYLMRRDGEYIMRLEPLRHKDERASWRTEFFEEHFQCAKEWLRLPSEAQIGGYKGVVLDLSINSLHVWPMSDPAKTLHTQLKPDHPASDRGSFAYCPWNSKIR